MRRRIVDRESVPDFSADLFAEQIGHRLTAVNVEIVHNQLDGGDGRVLHDQLERHLRELNGRTVWRRKGEVTSGLRLYGQPR